MERCGPGQGQIAVLNPFECRARRTRLLTEMQTAGWDLFLTASYRTVYYLTGCLSPADAPTALLLQSDGRCSLFTSVTGDWSVDEVISVETYSIRRSISEPWHDLAALLAGRIPRGSAAVERAGTPGLIESLLQHPADATRTIARLRKRKHSDEIEEIQSALRLCAAAYDAARTVIAPGLTEIDVYSAMYDAVVHAAGTSVVFDGDFACGVRAVRGGGPPTRRRLGEGDLYILDLFPAPALYFADTCRTFAVSQPSDEQFRAWETVQEAVKQGEAVCHPGVAARDVYREVKSFLDSHAFTENSFWHHAGHGIGHHGHEAPRLIPGSDDVLEVGDVLTLEPGIYPTALQGGIRLEDNYVLAADGLINLFDYPMDL